MRGFYFNTTNNVYYYDDITGVVSAVSHTDLYSRTIIWGNEDFQCIIQKKSVIEALDSITTSQLTLILTEDCNLRCKYCSYSGTYANNRKHSNNKMPVDIAFKAVDGYYDHFQNIRANNLKAIPTIGFFGGEPLLEFPLINRVVEFANEKFDKKVVYVLTTNAIALNDYMIDFFIENDFSLTISLNGTKEEHDRLRVDKRNNGTYDVVMNKLESIRVKNEDYYNTNVNFSFTFDVGTDLYEQQKFFSSKENHLSNHHIAASIIGTIFTDWYEQYNYTEKLRFNEQYRSLEKSHLDIIKNSQTVDCFYSALFSLKYFNILNRNIGSSKGLIPFSGACMPGSKIAVDYQGKLYACERVNNSRSIGNVDDWLDYEKIYNIVNEYTLILGSKCANCPATRFCTLCYKDVYDANGDIIMPDSDYCNKTIKSCQYYFENIYGLLEEGKTVEQIIYGRN